MSNFPILSLVVFLPLAGAVVLLFLKEPAVRWLALIVSVADLLLSLPLWAQFDHGKTEMQFVEDATWITSPPIHYHLGVDGISLPLVLLTTFLLPLCVLVSWRTIQTRLREFMATLLIMETA